jgi:hypothetical protein
VKVPNINVCFVRGERYKAEGLRNTGIMESWNDGGMGLGLRRKAEGIRLFCEIEVKIHFTGKVRE